MHANNSYVRKIYQSNQTIKYDNIIKRIEKFYYSRVDLSASSLRVLPTPYR